MIRTKTMSVVLTVAGSCLLATAPLHAQTAPAPAAAQASNPSLVVGATIKDTSGNTVGTIDAVEANGIIVNTGRNQIAIPASSFGAANNAPLLAATRAELDAAADAAAAEERKSVLATLQNGAPVVDAIGTPLGTVNLIEGDIVVIKMDSGEAQVPVNSLRMRSGSLAIAMTAEAFSAAVEAARTGS